MKMCIFVYEWVRTGSHVHVQYRLMTLGTIVTFRLFVPFHCIQDTTRLKGYCHQYYSNLLFASIGHLIKHHQAEGSLQTPTAVQWETLGPHTGKLGLIQTAVFSGSRLFFFFSFKLKNLLHPVKSSKWHMRTNYRPSTAWDWLCGTLEGFPGSDLLPLILHFLLNSKGQHWLKPTEPAKASNQKPFHCNEAEILNRTSLPLIHCATFGSNANVWSAVNRD